MIKKNPAYFAQVAKAQALKQARVAFAFVRRNAGAFALALCIGLLGMHGAHATGTTVVDPDPGTVLYDKTVYANLPGQTQSYVGGLIKDFGVLFIIISLAMTALRVAKGWAKGAFH